MEQPRAGIQKLYRTLYASFDAVGLKVGARQTVLHPQGAWLLERVKQRSAEPPTRTTSFTSTEPSLRKSDY